LAVISILQYSPHWFSGEARAALVRRAVLVAWCGRLYHAAFSNEPSSLKFNVNGASLARLQTTFCRRRQAQRRHPEVGCNTK
jgi:hypothetical protein